jgi:integrase/recombinase XerD
MLNLWRRHTKTCRHDSRESFKCSCPIWIDWTPPEGKRIRKPLGIRDWQAAQRRAREIEADGFSPNKSTITIEEALDKFEIDRYKGLQEPTIRKYKFFVRKLREFCKSRGFVFLNQLSVEECRNFRNTWNLGNLTDRKQLERFKSFLNFCVDSEWLKASPAKSLKPIRKDGEDESKADPFTEEEVQKILVACDSYDGDNRARLKVLTKFMLESGLRIGDAVTISKDKIVENKNKEYEVTLQTQKKKKSVKIPISAEIAREVLALDSETPFWTGKSDAEDCASLWRKAFARLFKVANVEGHPHQFRHTFAKRLFDGGAALRTVSLLLGHRREAITEKHYSNWIPERQAAVNADVRAARLKTAGTPAAH